MWGHPERPVPMPKTYDYIEWNPEDADAPRRRSSEGAGVENLFDREIRRRVGELIARAANGVPKRGQ